jgi:hypothetical protein
MNILVRWMVPVGVALWLLAGCATPPEPFEYRSENEIKSGPGLITGEEGAFIIYGEPAKTKAGETPAEETAPAEPAAPSN